MTALQQLFLQELERLPEARLLFTPLGSCLPALVDVAAEDHQRRQAEEQQAVEADVRRQYQEHHHDQHERHDQREDRELERAQRRRNVRRGDLPILEDGQDDGRSVELDDRAAAPTQAHERTDDEHGVADRNAVVRADHRPLDLVAADRGAVCRSEVDHLDDVGDADAHVLLGHEAVRQHDVAAGIAADDRATAGQPELAAGGGTAQHAELGDRLTAAVLAAGCRRRRGERDPRSRPHGGFTNRNRRVEHRG